MRAEALPLSTAQAIFLWCALAALAGARLLAMTLIPVTDTTEARYAEIARKMLETGDWITPQFDYGIPFWGKPPLHTWLSAGGMAAFGVTEFAARLPIFLLACALVALVYIWARDEQGRGFALVGMTILASSGLFFVASGVVMTDLALTAGTTLSMVAFWRALGDGSNLRLWGYLIFVGLAVGLLAKGPLAVVLTAIPIGLWMLMRRRWGTVWRAVPWITGTALMLAIAAPWYIAAELKTPGFLQYFIIGEHFERFTVPGWKGDLYGSGHSEPKGMIWLFGLLAFLPWTFAFLRPAWRWRSVRAAAQTGERGWRLYLLLWVLSPLLLFTAARNIIIPYVLPGVPAAAFLLVQTWVDAHPQGEAISARTARVFHALTAAFVVVMTAFSVAYVVAPHLISKKSQYEIITAARASAPADVGEMLYWRKRYYSAEFYTHGMAKRLETADALRGYLSDERRDFLVVRPSALPEIPAEMLAQFNPLGAFGKDLLFIERPLAPLPEGLRQ